jgi:hypothetical protein
MRVMLTAGEARSKALNDIIVLREIRDIEEEILIASAAGDFEVDIQSTSTMAKLVNDPGFILATEYYDTFVGTRDDRAKYLQMEKVLRYFGDLGYAIERVVNPGTNSTFIWSVKW